MFRESLQERVARLLSKTSMNTYKPLPAEESRAVRAIYAAQLPQILLEEGPLNFFTPKGSLLATGYERIVIGDYGAYIECAPEHIVRENIQLKWPGEPSRPIKYLWWRPIDGSAVKLYEQRGTVSYADYKVGCWYFAPSEVIIV